MRKIIIFLVCLLPISFNGCADQATREESPADHPHTTVIQAQTVDDPVRGFCGNTIVKVKVDNKEYEFMGSDAVNLTDILINMDYDPDKLCKCLPSIEVETEVNGVYGLEIGQEEGYARSADGQAELTAQQLTVIREIIDRLGNNQ